MRKFNKIAAGTMAVALSVSVPVTSAAAATRPASAVPAAASTSATVAQYRESSVFAAWPAYAIIALTLFVATWIVVDDDKGPLGIPVSRG